MVYPVIGAFLPFLSGILITVIGLKKLFAVAALAAFVPLAYTMKTQSDVKIKFDLRKAISETKRVRSIILVEGFWQGVDWMAVPLFTLYYIKSGLKFGAFLSYVGLAGAFAALLLCMRSDKSKSERTKYVLPAVTLTGIFTVFSGIAPTLGYWLILRGFVGFLASVTAPFTMSVLVDKAKSIRDTMLAREVYLNLGRITGVFVLTGLYFTTGDIQQALVVSGVIFMLYPILVLKNKLYPTKISVRSLITDEVREFSDG